jgi:hypothetical protein
MAIYRTLMYYQMLYKKAFCILKSAIKIPFKAMFFILLVGTFLFTTVPSHSQQAITPGSLPPEIKTIYKPINFPNESGSYGIKVVGRNFGGDPSKVNLYISKNKDKNGEFNEGVNEKLCWVDKCPVDTKVKGKIISNRELEFQGISKDYAGEVGIQIGIGEGFSNIYPTIFSVSPKEKPLLLTGGVLSIILLAILILSWRLVKITKTGKSNSLFSFVRKFFIDFETNTISLSAFQFYVWTFTAISGYLYLFFSRSLIQGKLEFIDIPPGLPGIVLISSATILFSEGISNTKGSKGAGKVEPEWSDLISIGGVITPERVQFFIWTVLGSFAFLYVAFLQTPDTIKDLPQVPVGFLQLMGVSSFGYIGGKFARKAGPIISEVNAQYGEESLVLNIHGSALSVDAKYEIGGITVSSAMTDEMKPLIITSNDSNEPSLAKHLRLTISKQYQNSWSGLEGRKFKITNPDGQFAEWEITTFPSGQRDFPPERDSLPPGQRDFPPQMDSLPSGQQDFPPQMDSLPSGERDFPPERDSFPSRQRDFPSDKDSFVQKRDPLH